MEYQTIISEKKDYITTITLNRPDSLNALNDQIVNEMSDAFASADSDEDTRVVVITGVGRAFCSGADLREERSGRQAG
ncbi:MAG: enoyl-CoA hydratase-related protein, partial [Dehalococcoidia bacterium]|nr:enoyl-CoA hydratase-related protein [Dehalococcoidia bacterium]